MARDAAEFSEYVALRWPPMIRTARLLTGDDGLAEDLVQTALEKCYVAWPRLRARDATDAYVRRAIVNTFISSSPCSRSPCRSAWSATTTPSTNPSNIRSVRTR